MALLDDHPIFSPPKGRSVLELSTSFEQNESGRRQTMVLKENDLILAAGHEIRIASFSDAKLSSKEKQSYKTLHTPNIQFDIHQMVLNPTGKFLAVAGAFQVAVITIPPEHGRLVSQTIDCKSFQVGQFYHATKSSPPIAKIDWHPWGIGGSTLLVMTVDGKLREYDVAEDPEEPQQVLSFVSNRKAGKSYLAEDPSEREVASFALGKGRGDWGPLTVFAVMKSGDVYSICPYLPQNAFVPSSYVHSLECFIAAKQEFLSRGNTSTASRNLSTLYEYQHKYVSALLKQLSPGTVFPSISRSVAMHPPSTIKSHPARQGPFLLQPSPRILDGSEGGDATDIAYLTFGSGDDNDETDNEGAPTEHLGVVLIAYQDGKVDVCLDVEKVEARWENKQDVLPMLAVYETVDLGLVNSLASLSVVRGEPSPLSLLRSNHPVFLVDPIHDDTVYIYHAFGVHALSLASVLEPLANALRTDEDDGAALKEALDAAAETAVKPILSTFSVERKCSNPVVAVAVPDDVYLSYSIYILTSTMRVASFSLNVRAGVLHGASSNGNTSDAIKETKFLVALPGPPAYVSLLGQKPFEPSPVLSSRSGLPSHPRLSLPTSQNLMLTPDTLRFIATTVTQLSGQIKEALLNNRATEARALLQAQELLRQCEKCREMQAILDNLRGAKCVATEARLKKLQDDQRTLLARLDRMLQSMMEKASPDLSESETKWFEELKRMKDEVMGAGRYDEGSLISRTRSLEREYDRLLPSLKALMEKEKHQRLKNASTASTLGFSQAFELGERANFERGRLSNLEHDIARLATKVDVTLGHTPAL